MIPRVFLVFLSLQYLFASGYGGSNLYKYERIFKSKKNSVQNMEPFLLEGERQSSCRPQITCNPDYPYRTIPGWCNNLQNPYWGASLLPFRRLLRPAYANGVDSPRGDGPNQFLPRPRDVSFPLHNIRDPTLAPNDGITLLVMQFGQFLDHDMFITPEKEGVVGCCDDFVTISTSDPECRPIDVSNDPFYDQFGVKCLQFIRSTPFHIREQQNNLTAYIDGSQIYGSTYETSEELRHVSDPAFLKISNFNEDTFFIIF
ncbi:Peroxidasin-like protein [Armadillidium vulgare]|nr:Peroxidasin-like protein [Armadillidium vulgare]